MRFLANGPSIPDELLVARDEGRVLFFCGAGVSRARARLPDFFQLANDVVTALGCALDSPARELLDFARETQERKNIAGIVTADRIFGLLERDYSTRDIHGAVAKALKPPEHVDLSAHRILLDLARRPDGTVCLATTNFDRLFEACDPALTSSAPPRLPDPRHYKEMGGVVHLHGVVDKDYRGADGDGFVLSGAEFGSAYISQAWATRFVSAALEKYMILFVGYAADDPPVQYLLEALNRDLVSRGTLYAFQAGTRSEAQSRWQHKGVQPIPYDPTPGHDHLWDSLAAWAGRARDPTAWVTGVVARAGKGPAELEPHERGQLAHIVGTLDGARYLATCDQPPPAEWLCVFDPAVRYAKPRATRDRDSESEVFIDPFERYGIDSDAAPLPVDPDRYDAKREIPQQSWSAFSATRLDRESPKPHQGATLTGYYSIRPSALSDRLVQLGLWLSRVANQPAAVWWAAPQHGLHPDIQSQIRYQLERRKIESSPVVRNAWRMLFEAWRLPPDAAHRDWFELKASIALDGWTPATIRDLASVHRPHLVAERPWSSPIPPAHDSDVQLDDLVSLDVKYPRVETNIAVPPEHMVPVVREFRKNLELAVLLESELGGYGLSMLPSVEPDADAERPRRLHGLAQEVLYFVELLKQLIRVDSAAARAEYASWWSDDDTVFARLRIWLCGEAGLFTGTEAGELLCAINDRVFWDYYHRRDLLVVLAKRWKEFPVSTRERLQRRILRGPPICGTEDAAEHEEASAHAALQRIEWLREQGCEMSPDIEVELSTLRGKAPQWTPAYAKRAAESPDPVARWVRTDSDYSRLLGIPRSEIVKRAQELHSVREHMFVERNPFDGLAAVRPVLALSALRAEAKKGNYPGWAWSAFLAATEEHKDKLKIKFICLIAVRLTRLPLETIAALAQPISGWMYKQSESLFKCPEHFVPLWDKIVAALRQEERAGASALVRGSSREWVTEAINAPAGKLAELSIRDPQVRDAHLTKEFPRAWLDRIEDLLSLPGDGRRYVVTILSRSLDWFHYVDAAWTEAHLVSALERDADTVNAFWSGVLWGGHAFSKALYARLKPHLLKLEREDWISKHSYLETLAGILLVGWNGDKNGEQSITDAEMREVLVSARDEFRAQVIWLLERFAEEPKPSTEPQPTQDSAEIIQRWRQRIPVFLRNVWPRNKSAKTPQTSARLAELAFSSVTLFPEIADIVTDLVVAVDNQQLMLYEFVESPDAFVSAYPDRVLALLSAILSDDVRNWPYGIEKVLDLLPKTNPEFLKDARLIELRRRWNAR